MNEPKTPRKTSQEAFLSRVFRPRRKPFKAPITWTPTEAGGRTYYDSEGNVIALAGAQFVAALERWAKDTAKRAQGPAK